MMAIPKIDNSSAEEMQTLIENVRRASELLKALAHETRLLIMCTLMDGEKSVSELEEITSMSQASVSQQLARLRFDRLVTTRREGRQMYYRLSNNEVSGLIGKLHEMFCAPEK